jgi:2-oxoglutarate dehydrogenase E1 component
MYKAIRSHPTTLDIYAKRLVGEGVVTDGEVEVRADWRARLDAEQEASQGYKASNADWLDPLGRDKPAGAADDPRRGNTASLSGLRTWARSSRRPAGLPRPSHHPAFHRARAKAVETGGHRLVDRRGAVVQLAAAQRHPVRLSGQDSERGTFSQRHSVLVDRREDLADVAEKQGRFEVINSMLSRRPCSVRVRLFAGRANALTLWEAVQRFASGAGIVDRTVVRRTQSAAHVRPRPASYRMATGARAGAFLGAARAFLQMCAETTCRSQHFDAGQLLSRLRRQLKRGSETSDLMTPKSLLRHKRGVGSTRWRAASFHRVLWGRVGEKIKLVADRSPRRAVLDGLPHLRRRERRGIDDIYILRVEQLYPFPTKALVSWGASSRRDRLVPGPQHGRWHFVGYLNGCSTRSRPGTGSRATRSRPRPRP